MLELDSLYLDHVDISAQIEEEDIDNGITITFSIDVHSNQPLLSVTFKFDENIVEINNFGLEQEDTIQYIYMINKSFVKELCNETYLFALLRSALESKYSETNVEYSYNASDKMLDIIDEYDIKVKQYK